MRSANIAPDKRQLMELHRQYIEDPVIHDLCRQKIAILNVANKYAVVNQSMTEVLDQFIDERSQLLIDKIDQLIEDRYQLYYSMLNAI